MKGPCEHCGSPDREKYGCRYAWYLPFAKDWKKSGADAPCYCDDFQADMLRRDRASRRNLGIALVVIVAALCWWMMPGWAHDNPTDWIGQERRTNAAGVLCCGKGDCTPFTVDQVKVMPDGYHFPDGDIVPFDKTAPSVDHFYYKCVWGAERKCTFAPMGAS